MTHKLYRVTDFQRISEYTLQVTFNDDTTRVINFRPVLYGEVFGPLRDLALFTQVQLDHNARTLVWPNGADFDPETLHNWDPLAMAQLGQRWAAAEPAILAT
ncbi:MAG TPA: DUF2442 domain-containing protein [Caldilineaceae bacterium]|nr:DUF2442 domain-containing protein [Caldilineaceae bacterium]